MITSPNDFWRKCTTCKKPIGFRQKYWICSVSTCNRVRTDLVFCDLKCFDAHVPVLNHRDAGAFERLAPPKSPVPSAQSSAPLPKQIPTAPKPLDSLDSGDEILVVVSKVKAYIRTRSHFNTSDSVMDLLSDRIRKMADQAIKNAEQHGRKTVLDRDVFG